MGKKCVPAELPEPEVIDLQALSDALRDGSVDLVCVLGPTASGKTRYAVSLARTLGGEIISADSRQVYRGMDIGTGKDLAEYGEVPYHLIDILPAGAQYNVHSFQEDFFRAYRDIRSRGRIPILCGGTGLYINAATAGYDFVEKKPLSARRETDPEVSESGKRPLASCSWVHKSASGPLSELSSTSGLQEAPRTFFIGTLVDRQTRNAKIDTRLDARLREGMVEEIRGLLESGVPKETLISYGLEYKFVTQYLIGELSFEQMRESLAIAIHQFAKRQMTWFRGMERSGVRIHWSVV